MRACAKNTGMRQLGNRAPVAKAGLVKREFARVQAADWSGETFNQVVASPNYFNAEVSSGPLPIKQRFIDSNT